MKKDDAIPLLPLSERQWEFIAFLNAFHREAGRAPSFREIAVALDVSSKGTVSTMVERLEAKGVLDRDIGLHPLLETGSSRV